MKCIMDSRRIDYLIIALFAIALALVGVKVAFGQETSVSIGVLEGTISEKTTFNSTANIDGNIYNDTYTSNFRAPNANISFDKNFSGMGVITNVTGMAMSGYIIGKEVIGTQQVWDKSCCGAAAGASFIVTGIEYKGNASPGGLGACCGVNFTADVPQSVGRLSAAAISMNIGETTVETGEGENVNTSVVFETSLYKEQITVVGPQNDFVFQTVSPLCPPAAGAPEEPSILPEFKLCVPGSELMPWEITP
jgi:hypothetical protein